MRNVQNVFARRRIGQDDDAVVGFYFNTLFNTPIQKGDREGFRTNLTRQVSASVGPIDTEAIPASSTVVLSMQPKVRASYKDRKRDESRSGEVTPALG